MSNEDERGPLYERPKKASHLHTLWYEVDMLDYCLQMLSAGAVRSKPEESVYLEGFLLHYRNVLRFLSGIGHRRSDLSTAEPKVWAGRVLTPEEVEQIQRPAVMLDSKYHADISQYLQHCTVRRMEDEKQWNVSRMNLELQAIIEAFQRSFPRP